MATNEDEISTEIQTDTTTQTETLVPESNTNDIDTKMNELFDKFNAKINEITSTFNSKLDEKDAQLKARDEEISKLKDVNKAIIMSTTPSNKSNDAIDFNAVEFDDVDWDIQAKKYMDNIDSKILG